MNKKHSLLKWIVGALSIGVVLYYQILAAPKSPGAYRFHFNLYILILLVGFALNIALYIKVIRVKSNRGVVLWFSFVPLLNALWLVYLSGMFFANDPQVGQYWQHMLPLAWIAIPPFLLFFVLSYLDDTDLQRGFLLWTMPIVAIISTIYISGMTEFLQYFTPHVQDHFFWGYDSNIGTSTGVTYIWEIGFMIISLVLLVRALRRSKQRLEKRQLRIFIWAVSIYIAMIIVFDIIYPFTPLSNTHPLPSLAFLYTTILAALIGYGILRYRIFKVTPAALSGTILQSLTEAVVAVNEDFEVQFTNAGTEALFGHDQQQLKGQHMSQLLTPHVYEAVQARLSKPDSDVARLADIVIINSRKAVVPVELSVGMVYDEHQAVAGYVFVFTNVTELKIKTQELAREKSSVEQKVVDRTRELSEEHAKLTASINSLKLGYVMTGVDDAFQIMNPSSKVLLRRLADSKKVSITGDWGMQSLHSIFGSITDLPALVKRALTEQKSFELKEVRIAEWYIHVFIAPVTESGKVIGSVILLEDITEEKALNRSKDEFFVLASHELRTPLTKISGSAEIIREVYASSITSEGALKMLSEIEQSSAHLIEIVGDFIQISELEQRKVSLTPEDFVLADLIAERLHKASGKAKEGVTIGIESTDQLLHVIADKEKVQAVLDRLLDNAFKFTETGSISVGIHKQQNSVKVTITDTGKGVKQQNHSLLFRKFQQAGSSLLTRDGEGTGLGLYIAKLIVEQLGGTIGLQSSEEGKGSVFYFELPLTQVVNPKLVAMQVNNEAHE
jgi:PAS domain S-box-containing protein